jgi:hypothetical protein
MEYMGKVHHNPVFSPGNRSLGKFWGNWVPWAKAGLAATPMTKNSDPVENLKLPPPLSLEKAEKGSHRSMWELLLQLRVLLPYLARLVPLLDRALVKTAPDLSELTKGIAGIQDGSRDLEVQARNQALQLERIEQQMGRLRVVHENGIEESRRLYADIRSLRRWILAMAIAIVVLLLAMTGMIAYLMIHR